MSSREGLRPFAGQPSSAFSSVFPLKTGETGAARDVDIRARPSRAIADLARSTSDLIDRVRKPRVRSVRPMETRVPGSPAPHDLLRGNRAGVAVFSPFVPFPDFKQRAPRRRSVPGVDPIVPAPVFAPHRGRRRASNSKRSCDPAFRYSRLDRARRFRGPKGRGIFSSTPPNIIRDADQI